MMSVRLLSRIPTRFMTRTKARVLSSQAMPLPQSESTPISEKQYPEKIVTIVESISKLTLLEVADLNELLKHRLNISDAPVMMAGNFGGMGQASPVKEDEEEAAPPVAVQTSFSVKMESFDAAKKVSLIKEIKNLIEGMNLVQAKKFVESCPTIVKADLSKEEADKLKEALIAVGAQCVVE